MLLQRVAGVDFWFLPGGRVEMLESAQEAREELGIEAGIGRLLWVAENFFAMGGYQYHDLGLYFTMDVSSSLDRDEEFAAVDPTVELQWLPMDDLPLIRPVLVSGTARAARIDNSHRFSRYADRIYVVRSACRWIARITAGRLCAPT